MSIQLKFKLCLIGNSPSMRGFNCLIAKIVAHGKMFYTKLTYACRSSSKNPAFRYTLHSADRLQRGKKCKLVLCSDVFTSVIISSSLLRPQKSIQQKTSNCRTRSPGSFLRFVENFHRLNPSPPYSSLIRKFVSSEW